MHICLITMGYPSPYEPGKFAFVDQLACTWADMGHEVSVVYPIPSFVKLIDKNRFYKSKWLRNTSGGKTVSVICPRYISMSEKTIMGINTIKISYRSFQQAVLRTITHMKRKPDVLYGHFLPCGCHAADIGDKEGIPSFCAFGESSLWSIERWNISEVRNSLSKLSGMVSVSTENKRVLVDNELYREKDIEIFPNGADHSFFYPMNKQEIRKKYGFDEKETIGVYTGTFNHDKGILRAQEAVLRAGNVKMIYIGGGEDKPVGNNILFMGRLQHDKIPEYLNAADFFILPTKAEGCCNAIVEAMACGLPVISSDGAYNDDILSEEYAIRTDPMDIDAMTKAVISIRDNSKLRAKMSQAAKEASMRFDINKRAEAIIDFMKRKSKK